jgi:hypothetical protein
MVGKSLVVQEAGKCSSFYIFTIFVILGLPVDDQPEFDPKPIKRSNSDNRERSSSDGEVPAKFPLLQRVIQLFDDFYKRQILIACTATELLNDSAENSKQMQKLDFNIMEQKVLCLGCGITSDILNELPGLSEETRVSAYLYISHTINSFQIQIIKQTTLDVAIVLKTYLTCKRFPTFGDPRLALFHG